VELSHRFISGRFLPDKAIDLLDTACAKVKMSLFVKPAALEDAERGAQSLERELNALERDAANGGREDIERLKSLREQIAALREKAAELAARWEKERAAAGLFVAARDAYGKAVKSQAEDKAREDLPGAGSPAGSTPDILDSKRALDAARADYEAVRGEEGLISVEVSSDIVAQVVSDWTGIPVGRVAQEEAALVADLETRLSERVKGQDTAIETVAKVIKASKAGLCAPGSPIGVFLLVGPSGVGKTETGLALAELLFGDEESAITINMSEFQERHTVSRLVGSPPGYVGYGEGGLLTEAVRRRPYSVILLDEVEKAHPDVMNLFYQVFDKGELTDGEGKKVSFASTVILLTSNLGSEKLHEAAQQGITDSEELKALIHRDLAAHFKPALLARMTVVPYAALAKDALERIARMKLDALGKRLQANNAVSLRYSGSVVTSIIERCGEVDTGARNIDHILAANVLPRLAQTMLEKMAEERACASEVCLDVSEDGAFSITFADSEALAEHA
jgi:type VI secretion system protein VasG